MSQPNPLEVRVSEKPYASVEGKRAIMRQQSQTSGMYLVLLALTLLLICGCGKKTDTSGMPPQQEAATASQLPEYYGLYAVDQGQTVPLQKSGQEFTGSVQFILFDHSAAMGTPELGLRQLSLRSQIDPHAAFKEGNKPFTWNEWFQMTQVDEPKRFEEVMSGIPQDSSLVAVRVKPVTGKPEMLQFVPEAELAPGLYMVPNTGTFWIDRDKLKSLLVNDVASALQSQQWKNALDDAAQLAMVGQEKSSAQQAFNNIFEKASAAAKNAIAQRRWIDAQQALDAAIDVRPLVDPAIPPVAMREVFEASSQATKDLIANHRWNDADPAVYGLINPGILMCLTSDTTFVGQTHDQLHDIAARAANDAIAQGHWDAVLPIVNIGLAMRPGDPALQELRNDLPYLQAAKTARDLFASRQWSAAITAAQQALLLRQGSAEMAKLISDANVCQDIELAKQAKVNQNWRLATQFSRKVLWLQPDNHEMDVLCNDACVQLDIEAAQRDLNRQLLDVALDFANSAVSREPDVSSTTELLKKVRQAMSDDPQYFGRHYAVRGTFTSNIGRVTFLKASNDGQWLVAGGDGGLMICDLANGKSYHSRAKQLCFCPMTRGLVCGIDNPTGTVHTTLAMDVAARNLLWRRPGVICYGLSPDGKTVVVGDQNGLEILDFATGLVNLKIPFHCYNFAWGGFNADSSLMAFVADQKCYVYSLADGRLVRTYPDARYNCSFGADQSIALDMGGSIQVLNVSTGEQIAAIPFDGSVYFSGTKALSTWKPAGLYGSSILDIWDPVTGRQLAQGLNFKYIESSQDGKILAITNGGLPAIRGADGSVLSNAVGIVGDAQAVAFLPDGRLIIGDSHGRVLSMGRPQWSSDTGLRTIPYCLVSDAANLFSPSAKAKANARINAVKRQYGIDLVIETFQNPPNDEVVQMNSLGNVEFFNRWIADRQRVRGRQGLYLLGCRNPSLWVWNRTTTMAARFPDENMTKLKIDIGNFANANDLDGMLEQVVTDFEGMVKSQDNAASSTLAP